MDDKTGLVDAVRCGIDRIAVEIHFDQARCRDFIEGVAERVEQEMFRTTRNTR